ncbi:MAG: glycoside hydrolase family 25 protein [Bacteroides sp.]|nr:glycoside hydrolase family 25 protein [Eubacterium sp.]MCM1417284.1 glycoside hydrolase family 25 protein [Roseburia sp.]MCM1461096.1 glycoside hydrolase family 25 protein [Bacteroides sp.]
MEEKTELERFITAPDEEEASGDREEAETDEVSVNDTVLKREGEAPYGEETSSEEEEELSEEREELPEEEEVFSEAEETLADEPEPTIPTDQSIAETETILPTEEKTTTTETDGSWRSAGKPRSAAVGLGIANIAVAVLTLGTVAASFLFFKESLLSFQTETEELQQKIDSLEEEKRLLESDYIEVMNILEEEPDDSAVLSGIEAESGKILIYDSSVGYSWIPVLSELPQHNYRKSGFFVDERGRMRYTERGEASSYFGIDVSSYQGDIDWQLAKEDGVEFAFLRIGYRGYGEEGKLCADEKFVQNYEGAHDAGIDIGIYFFSQAITSEEAAEEASFLLDLLDVRTLEYPIVYDWETVVTPEDDPPPRTEDVMPQTLTLSAISFCEAIEDAGYEAMIYTNKKQAVMKYDLRQLRAYPVWLAYYDTNLNYCYDFDVWQYGTGSVDGIEGEVDLNIAMIKR